MDGEAANMGGYKMNQTISDLLKRGPNQLIMFVVRFTRPVFAGDGPDNRAGVHGVTSSDLSSRDHGHLVIWSMIQHKKGRYLTKKRGFVPGCPFCFSPWIIRKYILC